MYLTQGHIIVYYKIIFTCDWYKAVQKKQKIAKSTVKEYSALD